jgi:AAA domain/DnaB-like helicase N terminal domain
VSESLAPPQNLDAEESVLGAILAAAATGSDAAARTLDAVQATGLKPGDFYRESHGIIFVAARRIADRGEPPDYLAVERELERAGELAGDRRIRLRELVALAPAWANADHHARLVMEAARRRRASDLGTELVRISHNGGLDASPGLRDELRVLLEPPPAGGRRPLEALTARDLVALPDPPGEDELLGSLAARGQRLVIGGHTGEGKTTLALALVKAAVSGEGFLGWHGQGGCRALVIDAEQGLKTIKRRLREAGLDDCEAVEIAMVPDGLSLDSDPGDIAALEARLAAGAYDLVVADPLYKLHTGDSNEERQAVNLMRRLDTWRVEYGFALILPVHCRKPIPGTKFSIHDLFGSSAYVRGAEVVIGVRRIARGVSELHFLKDRDGDLPVGDKWRLLFDRESGFRRDPKGDDRDVHAELVERLSDGNARTAAELAKPEEKGGIGRNRDDIEAALTGDPDTFRSVSGKEIGRSPRGTFWLLARLAEQVMQVGDQAHAQTHLLGSLSPEGGGGGASAEAGSQDEGEQVEQEPSEEDLDWR